jgi:hypothetical protein
MNHQVYARKDQPQVRGVRKPLIAPAMLFAFYSCNF